VVEGHAVVPSVAVWAWSLAEEAATKGGLEEKAGGGEGAGFGLASCSTGQAMGSATMGFSIGGF
jgi:hypothetical protein